MKYFYELIEKEEGLPIKAFIYGVDEVEIHCHNEMEIILVLQGSINIRVGNKLYTLHENDFILINRNEIHNISKIKEDNILVILQIDLNQHISYFPIINRVIFDCKSFLYKKEEQESLNQIKHHMAKILWELNKKSKGYQLIVGSEVYMLTAYLYNNFSHSYSDDEKAMMINTDLDRIQSIVKYINDNLDRNIKLQQIADSQKISICYLSHFIKKKLGFSFREYLINSKLDKALNMLLTSNKTITEISYASGFPSTKSINKLFKEAFGCSPTEYRRKNIEAAFHANKAQGLYFNEKKITTYLEVDRKAVLKKLFTHLKPLENGINDDNRTV